MRTLRSLLLVLDDELRGLRYEGRAALLREASGVVARVEDGVKYSMRAS